MLPPEFLTRMQKLLGDEYVEFKASYDQPADIGLRINTLKISPEKFHSISPFQLSPIPWTQSGFVIEPGERPGKHPYHTASLYYLQDPAAMAVAELLSPQPGERILDLAAAPGGKATHIAALIKGEGILFANDPNKRRAQVLAKNLERWGARNAVVLNETPTRLADHFGAYFDRVLVDAPCSGEGMFRKAPDARGDWMPGLVDSCSNLQDTILADAAHLVRPGGVLVYATCTFAPEEDEGTIARFVQQFPEFEIISTPTFSGFSKGRPDWIDSPLPDVENTVRLWPHMAAGEGHFIAVLRKAADVSKASNTTLTWRPDRLPQEAERLMKDFCERTLSWFPEEKSLALMGSHLYQLPNESPELRGLRVIHWGWWLGVVKKNRFEPSHALGMGLQGRDFTRALSLTRDGPQLDSYLRGEVLSSPGENGWVMVMLDNFPLGWGKRVNGRLKTHLPKWLRQF